MLALKKTIIKTTDLTTGYQILAELLARATEEIKAGSRIVVTSNETNLQDEPSTATLVFEDGEVGLSLSKTTKTAFIYIHHVIWDMSKVKKGDTSAGINLENPILSKYFGESVFDQLSPIEMKVLSAIKDTCSDITHGE